MTDKADLKRIQADLQEAQAEIETASKVDDSLGGNLSFGFKSLLAAVGQLFAGFNNHEDRLFKHDGAVKIMQGQIADLQTQIHGLKISKGKAIAAKQRALVKAQAAMDSTKSVLDRISIH